MSKQLTVSIAALATMTLAAPAAAQDPTTDATEPGATTDPAATDPAAPATGEPVAIDAALAPASRWPRSVIARPLTLPKGLLMIGADFAANNDFSIIGAGPIVGYGITDDLEIQAVYGFGIEPAEGKGSFNADIGYKLLRGAAGGKLEVIARVRAGYDLLAEAANPLLLGVHVQYNVTDKIAIISGVPGSQQLRISLAEDEMTMVTPIDFSLPVGVGFQATPELYLQLDTRLATIEISDSDTTFIGADTTPVALTVVYNAIPALDIQAAIGTDLSNEPGDTLVFLLGARYYIGDL